MAGTGVTVGGAGMLRTRRRDVSIKPNRRLDRKSSRGMIYENEELRLRTIHINAEVEQGQNDIKKLRRENEQLRREIWSLRDEYEKLEVLIKTQSSHGSSDEIEGRSEEDENNDEVFTEYSGEEDVVEEDVEALPEDGESNEEHLDNAENQKISTEKMNSSNLHRLHVAFDDLSIVDEEDELRKEKEKKDSVSDENQKDSSDAKGSTESVAASEAVVVEVDKQSLDYFVSSPRLYDHQHHQHRLNPDLSSSEQTYFSDCPFVFPSPSDPNYPKMLPMDGVFGCLGSSVYSSSSSNRLEALPSLETPGIGPVASAFEHSDHFFPRPMANQARDLQTQMGAWHTTSGNHQMPGANLSIGTLTPRMSTTTTMPRGTTRPSGQVLNRDHSDIATSSHKPRLDTPIPGQILRPTWRKPPAMYSTSSEQLVAASRRQQSPQDLLLGYGANAFHKNPTVETVSQNGWDSARSPDKPKHFFAPLSSTLSTPKGFAEENCGQDFQATATGRNNQDAANSSSSEKTTSTVISGHRPPQHPKGSADLYVAGAFPAEGDTWQARGGEQSTFLTFENLLVEEARSMSRQNSNNPLTKSLSCQDLSTDQQMLPFAEKLSLLNGDNGTQKLAKSDNTLDNISNSSRPYRSQLHVTLRQPRRLADDSSEAYTPEIPKLPSINYRLFNNPFLQSLDQQRTEYASSSLECPTLSRPLSIQVDETRDVPFSNGYGCYTSPVVRGLPTAQRSALERDYWRLQAENDSRMLLMAANNKQFRSFEQDASGNLRSQPIGFEMTSFEGPNPRTLRRPGLPFASEPQQHSTMNLQGQRLYQNVQDARLTPVPFCGLLGPMGPVSRLPFDAGAASIKVPAQTQTSIDGDSQKEGADEPPAKGELQSSDIPGSPLSLRRRRTSRKERSGSVMEKRPLSPAAQRRRDRGRKTHDSSADTPMDFSSKSRLRKFSMASSGVQDKIESRSSSSGQDSPKKIEQRRRVSLYFNAKKRPSIGSTSVVRRSSLDTVNDERYLCVNDAQDGTTTNSERERTNSVSSRDTVTKGRKLSTGSDTVPWCACWGNGCV